MRNGDVVQKYEYVGRGIDQRIQLIGPKGVIFHIEHNIENDCFEPLFVDVRWEDGTWERIERDHENEVYPETELEVVTPELFVNVYLHDRAYGGPEEGGWWYDTRSPEDEMCVRCDTPEQVEKELARLQAWCDEENGCRNSNISSVCSEGRYEVCAEAWPAEGSPAYRPRYC